MYAKSHRTTSKIHPTHRYEKLLPAPGIEYLGVKHFARLFQVAEFDFLWVFKDVGRDLEQGLVCKLKPKAQYKPQVWDSRQFTSTQEETT